jgi:hypothetical protein
MCREETLAREATRQLQCENGRLPQSTPGGDCDATSGDPCGCDTPSTSNEDKTVTPGCSASSCCISSCTANTSCVYTFFMEAYWAKEQCSNWGTTDYCTAPEGCCFGDATNVCPTTLIVVLVLISVCCVVGAVVMVVFTRRRNASR